MRCLVLFILTFLSAKADKDIIPVFLMDDTGVMSHLIVDANPFSKLSTSHFADIVHDSIKRSEVVIIFVEDQFSVEDVSVKDNLGTPYLHLHQGFLKDRVKYFPGVIEPYKLLNQIFQPQAFNVFYLKSGMKLHNMFDEYFKYFYVFFQDGPNGTRAEMLRQHDSLMREVYTLVRNIAPRGVVAFYTGKMNPVEVERIQFVPITPISVEVDPGVMVVTDGALFRLVGVFAATQARRAMFNQIPIVAEETWTHRSLSTKMAYIDFELEFFFIFKERDWILEHVALLEGGEEVGRTYMEVGAPWKWAYYCDEPLVIDNRRDGSSVTITEYQIQPIQRGSYRRNVDSNSPDWEQTLSGSGSGSGSDSSGFGNTVNCGPYFTVGLLACLFVVAICLLILFFGIIFLFNCNSNNRYDDPQGKPLVIQCEGGHG